MTLKKFYVLDKNYKIVNVPFPLAFSLKFYSKYIKKKNLTKNKTTIKIFN